MTHLSSSDLLGRLRSLIDSALAGCLASVRARYLSSASEAIVEVVERATMPKGGRIRPLLCCLGYAAAGGPGGATEPRLVRAAASLELLHSFALIHDDVMDGSPTRRGEPSIHRGLADERRRSGRADADLHGISLAILAGDLALVLSDLLFRESGFPLQILDAAYEPLSRVRLDAIAGQYLDLTHSGPAGHDLDLAVRIARLKTGSYSVEGPLLVGAALGEGSPEACAALLGFARPLGEAFQLADDVAGLFGNPEHTGKDADNDTRRGKPTPLIARAVAMAGKTDREVIESIWGNPGAAGRQVELRKAVKRSGGLDATIAEIHRLVGNGLTALETGSQHLIAEPSSLLADIASQVARRAANTQ
ncbi:MAG: polyprenyl synthetase family protein [Actinomycetota bacterium]